MTDETPDAIERTAVELAQLAGAEMTAALGGMMSVSYKSGSDSDQWRDPVSEVDQRIETLIRARLAERFPDHEIIGEEMAERGGRGSAYVWAVDPIDGTANFVNGFPMFSATIGVLKDGVPIAGAIWCPTGHRVRSGVYHAHAGGLLMFDGDVVSILPNPDIRRRLAGVGDGVRPAGPWDVRKTGSAAIECAFVACGILRVARFNVVNLWDCAGGIALVKASGGVAYAQEDGQWQPLERFEGEDLRAWRRPVILGRPEDVEQMIALTP